MKYPDERQTLMYQEAQEAPARVQHQLATNISLREVRNLFPEERLLRFTQAQSSAS